MAAGTDWSTSSSRSAMPSAASILSRSSGWGPMCRVANRPDGRESTVVGDDPAIEHPPGELRVVAYPACAAYASPSVTVGSRAAMAYAVLVPERFRGCCPFGVIVVGVESDDLSRRPYRLRQAYRDGQGCWGIAVMPAAIVGGRHTRKPPHLLAVCPLETRGAGCEPENWVHPGPGNRKAVMNLIRRHPVLTFFLLAYVLTWGAITWQSFFVPGVL